MECSQTIQQVCITRREQLLRVDSNLVALNFEAHFSAIRQRVITFQGLRRRRWEDDGRVVCLMAF